MTKKYDPFPHEKVMEHPSFVTVSFNRVTGLRKVFGSSVQSHQWIELRVQRAKLRHNLGYDAVYGETRPIIEVALSPAQFAELITTMNVGSGVPGSLDSFDGKQIEQPADVGSETQRVREHYEKVLKARHAEAKQEVEAIMKDLEDRKSLTQDLKKRLRGVLDSLTIQSDNSMPFYIEQFQEATEKVMSQAKAEVDAFVTHAIHTTGLEKLRDQAPQLQIEDKTKVK